MPGTHIQPDLCGLCCENLPGPPEGVVEVRPDFPWGVEDPRDDSLDEVIQWDIEPAIRNERP